MEQPQAILSSLAEPNERGHMLVVECEFCCAISECTHLRRTGRMEISENSVPVSCAQIAHQTREKHG